jgi:hypothetical protein
MYNLKSKPLFVDLCETLLNDANVNVMDFSVPGYKVEYKCCSLMQRGGLATLTRSDVDFNVRDDLKIKLKLCLLKQGCQAWKFFLRE